MESKSTFKAPPVETFQADVQAHDIQRLELPSSNMLGAVVVGGCYTSDCFEDIGEVQAKVHGAD